MAIFPCIRSYKILGLLPDNQAYNKLAILSVVASVITLVDVPMKTIGGETRKREMWRKIQSLKLAVLIPFDDY